MVVVEIYFPMMEGWREREVARERRQRRVAKAPSEIWEEFPAVVVPVGEKAGGRWDSLVAVVVGRMESSRVMTVEGLCCVLLLSLSAGGLVMETGMISLSKRPDCWALEALRWESAANAS